MLDREGFNSFGNWLKARQVVVKQPGVAEVVEKLRLALKKQGDDLQKELEAVATILDCRVPWRTGHSNNVSRFALEVARKLGGFGQGEIELLRMACLLHDFGKFAVKEEILMKKGILTPEEMKLVRGHVEGGVLLLSPFEELRLILPAVREHHEHFDGRGTLPAWPRAKSPSPHGSSPWPTPTRRCLPDGPTARRKAKSKPGRNS